NCGELSTSNPPCCGRGAQVKARVPALDLVVELREPTAEWQGQKIRAEKARKNNDGMAISARQRLGECPGCPQPQIVAKQHAALDRDATPVRSARVARSLE